jgi:hypothetical protein
MNANQDVNSATNCSKKKQILLFTTVDNRRNPYHIFNQVSTEEKTASTAHRQYGPHKGIRYRRLRVPPREWENFAMAFTAFVAGAFATTCSQNMQALPEATCSRTALKNCVHHCEHVGGSADRSLIYLCNFDTAADCSASTASTYEGRMEMHNKKFRSAITYDDSLDTRPLKKSRRLKSSRRARCLSWIST